MRLEYIHFGMAEAMFTHRCGGAEGMGEGGGRQQQHMIVGSKWRKWSMSQVQEGHAKQVDKDQQGNVIFVILLYRKSKS